jgi:aspartyl aminopeptidase
MTICKTRLWIGNLTSYIEDRSRSIQSLGTLEPEMVSHWESGRRTGQGSSDRQPITCSSILFVPSCWNTLHLPTSYPQCLHTSPRVQPSCLPIMVRKTSAGLFDSVYADREYHTWADTRHVNQFVTSRPPAECPPIPEQRPAAAEELRMTSCVPHPQSCDLNPPDASVEASAQPEHNVGPAQSFAPGDYTTPYLDFMINNPTVFHAVDWIAKRLESAGYKHLSQRELWTSTLSIGGKYYTTRNGSAIIAFSVGKSYEPGNGVGIVAGHIDALTAKLKPIPKLQNKAGYVQLGVAPYASGGVSSTWWDRDLGIGGKVLVKDSKTGKIETRLVNLGWPIARIPTLAPHFGSAANGPFNPETQMVPIIGLDNSDLSQGSSPSPASSKIKAGTFAATQPERLVRAIAGEMSVEDYSSIVNWELELYDTQPAQLGGLDKEFIFAGRIDDKLCSWAAIEALLASSDATSPGIIKMVGCFDDEEIGSYLRQGARSNFMSSVIERICEGLSTSHTSSTAPSPTPSSCPPTSATPSTPTSSTSTSRTTPPASTSASRYP